MYTFSAAMITAIDQASAFIHTRVHERRPSCARSLVNITSGNTANGSCRLRITWLRISSGPVPRSP